MTGIGQRARCLSGRLCADRSRALCLQLQLIPFLRTDIIIGFIESQTLSIALLDIYLGYVAAA